MQYAVTIDVIHTVFSAFGFVQKIAIFEKSAGFQALVQYPDIPTAVGAKEALEGHCIYDGGFCKLHLSYSRHTDLNVNNDRSRDYTNPGLPPTQPPVLGQAPGVGGPGSPVAAGPGYPAAQYGAAPPPQDSGAQQQAWDSEGSGKAQQVSGPMQGQPMSGQQPMYMNHQQHGGAGGHSGHHGPPGAPGSYQGPPGAATSMGPMSGPPGMGGPMGPPGHMGSGMHQQGHMGPPGHSMPYQQMHGPGHQGMPPSNGGPGGYYM
jgi:polypyrimidine tract-binding protein 2